MWWLRDIPQRLTCSCMKRAPLLERRKCTEGLECLYARGSGWCAARRLHFEAVCEPGTDVRLVEGLLGSTILRMGVYCWSGYEQSVIADRSHEAAHDALDCKRQVVGTFFLPGLHIFT